MFIINLDELNFGELLEVFHQRARNGIECTIRLTTTGEVNMHHAIGKGHLAVPSKAVEHEGKTLVAFNIAGTFEVFIEDCANQIL